MTTTTNNSTSTTSSLPSEDTDRLTLRIQSFRNTNVQLPSARATVHDLHAAIAEALSTNNNSSMRLICKGRLLTPLTAPLVDFGVRDDDVVHAVVRRQATPPNNNNNKDDHDHHQDPESLLVPTSSSQLRPRGIVVGPGGRVTRSTAVDDDSSSSSDDEVGAERRGLDRLRGAGGLTRRDISVLRTYFGPQIDEYEAQHPHEYATETSRVRRRLLLEEDWMAVQGPTSEFRLNLSAHSSGWLRLGRLSSPQQQQQRQLSAFSRTTVMGTDRDFIWGFMLGFFVGFVMLVWVWMPTVPHKQKIGILMGISLQLAMAVLNESDENSLLDDQVEQVDTFGTAVLGG